MGEKKENLYKAVISILVISNLITLLIFYNRPQNYNLFVSLSGKSEHWIVEDYQVLYSTNYDYQVKGNPIVKYIGDDDDIESYCMESFGDLIGGSSHSEKGFESGRDYSRFGSTIGGMKIKKGFLKQLDQESYIIIGWKLKDGTRKKERIDLRLDTENFIMRELIEKDI